VVITFSVVNPLQLVAIPLALLLLALPPRTAGTLLLAVALGTLSFVGPRGTLWYVERGWALLLAGWFIVVVLAWPTAAVTPRAVAAVAAAMVSGAALVVAQDGWPALDHTIAAHYGELAATMSRSWPAGRVDGDMLTSWTAEIPARLFPALAALASAATLALVWWATGRITGQPRTMGRVREFRFPDSWIWVLIVGLALVLMPPSGWAPRLGLNLVVFMGALYALRGLGVTVTLVMGMAGTNRAVLAVLGMVGVLLYPIVVAGMLLLGVTDTWLDLRAGRGVANEEG
jgi:hypothetical protein